MPFTSAFAPDRRILRTTISFPLTFADIRGHVSKVRRDGTWALPELVDARSIGRVDFSARDMLGVAHFVRDVLGERPVAPRAVVVDTDRGFMIGRVFSSLVAGWIRIGIFEEIATAEDWLVVQHDGLGSRFG
jgi:hypothetical protein